MKRALPILALVLALPVFGAKAQEPLDPLARRFAAQRETLVKDFSAKRKALVRAPGWKALSAEEKQARLTALAAEFAARDAKLTEEYDAARGPRPADRAVKDAERLKSEREKLDDVRTRAAQDSRRAKP